MVNGHKFSKSLGNAIVPGYLIEKYGLDPLRYYMFRETPFGSDGDFSEANLVGRNNSELAQGLGNLVQRTISMVVKYRDGVVPAPADAGDLEAALAEAVIATMRAVATSIENLAFKDALEAIWGYISRMNVYINTRAPWALAKHGDDTTLDTALVHLTEGLRFLSVLVTPFMPGSGQSIAGRLGLKDVPAAGTLTWGSSLAGNRVEQGPPLFRILEPPVEEAPPAVKHAAEQAVLDLGVSYCVAQINGLKINGATRTAQARGRGEDTRARARVGGHDTGGSRLP